MKPLLYLLLFYFFIGADIGPVTVENKVNLNSLDFEFYPCDVESPVIVLNFASLKTCTDTLIVVKSEGDKYYWKNKSVLFRGKDNLGCYKFLCVTWHSGYSFFY